MNKFFRFLAVHEEDLVRLMLLMVLLIGILGIALIIAIIVHGGLA